MLYSSIRKSNTDKEENAMFLLFNPLEFIVESFWVISVGDYFFLFINMFRNIVRDG